MHSKRVSVADANYELYGTLFRGRGMRDGLKVTLAVSLESVGFVCQSIEEGLIILSFRLAYVQPRIVLRFSLASRRALFGTDDYHRDENVSLGHSGSPLQSFRPIGLQSIHYGNYSSVNNAIINQSLMLVRLSLSLSSR